MQEAAAIGLPTAIDFSDAVRLMRPCNQTTESFMRVKSIFVDILVEHKFEQPDIKAIGAIVDSLKADIVSS